MATTAEILPKAVALLARREHSRFDLGRKLQRYTQDQQLIEQVLDQLEEKNLLSNERFAQQFVRSRAARFGQQRLRYELQQHQLPAEQIEQVLQETAATEFERAVAVWQRKFQQPPEDQRDYARQFRFLSQRGFPPEFIHKILKNGQMDG